MKNEKSGRELPHLEKSRVLQSLFEGLTPVQILARDKLVDRHGYSLQEATKAVKSLAGSSA